jgi:HPt (histidine-containing phosphotransfer) domain-containing protein
VRSDELAAKLLYWSEHLTSATCENPQLLLALDSDLSAGAHQESLTSLIDWDYLHELSDGNEAFELELLETLMGATLPHLELLRTNIAIADFKKIEQEAHYIKGSTASIGAKGLEALAGRLEEQAQDQQIEDMDDLMLKIEQGFSQLRALITLMNP